MLCGRYNLAVSSLCGRRSSEAHICIVATKDKMMGFNLIAWFYSVYIMSSCSKHYSVCMNLIRREASIEAHSEWSNSSRCRQELVYLFMDVMPIYTWSLPWISHNYALFYQFPNSNLFTHHMLPTWEMPLRKTMAPGSIHLYIYKHFQYLAAIIYLLFYFAIYNYLQLSTQLICLQIMRSRGLTTLLPALGASCLLFFCATAEDGWGLIFLLVR